MNTNEYIDSFTLIRNNNAKKVTFIGYKEYPTVQINEQGQEIIVPHRDEALNFAISYEHAKALLKALGEQVEKFEE
ncbi:MAG: hypothetical protein ACOX7J_03445 [Bacillota bacterium]|jgi:hypothetical protein